MASSVLGPATIFLLIVGSLNVALDIPKFWALMIILIPMVGFIVLCLVVKTDTQVCCYYVLSLQLKLEILWPLVAHYMLS